MLGCGLTPDEAAQLELVACGIRCASLLERPLRPSVCRAFLQHVSLLRLDGSNMFMVCADRLSERLAELKSASPSALPVIVFAGRHHSRPREASDRERRVWASRMCRVVQSITAAVLGAQRTSAVAEFACCLTDNVGSDSVALFNVCPVSLSGWLLEYPVVYDVCGPYVDDADWPVSCAEMTPSTHCSPAEMHAGNCLAGIPLVLQTALFKPLEEAATAVIPTTLATVVGKSGTLDRTMLSFSYPAHLNVIPVITHWRMALQHRSRRTPSVTAATVGSLERRRVVFSVQHCTLDAVLL